MRSTQALSSGNRHEAVTELDGLRKILDWRHVGGDVIERGNAMFAADFGELRKFDLSHGIVRVEKVHHHGALVDGADQVVDGFDFHVADAAIADRVIVPVTVRLLDDDLGFHASGIGKPADFVAIGAGHASGGTEGESGSCSGSDHGSLATDE